MAELLLRGADRTVPAARLHISMSQESSSQGDRVTDGISASSARYLSLSCEA